MMEFKTTDDIRLNRDIPKGNVVWCRVDELKKEIVDLEIPTKTKILIMKTLGLCDSQEQNVKLRGNGSAGEDNDKKRNNELDVESSPVQNPDEILITTDAEKFKKECKFKIVALPKLGGE